MEWEERAKRGQERKTLYPRDKDLERACPAIKSFRGTGHLQDNKKSTANWVWWDTPIFPALNGQRQEDPCHLSQPGLQGEFQASQSYRVTLSQNLRGVGSQAS